MATVLIVDDSATVRELVADHLIQNGFSVIEAIDGVHGVDLIQKHPVDLVVTDIVMPNMNGYEFCRWMKNNPATKHIPVIMCTTKSEEFDRYWGMKQGADAYVVKPYRPPELLAVVRQLLSRVKG